ncbi:DUF5320 domain-containing protein [Chloroflexota bacterium]
MPGFDGTGPQRMGPMTGGGRGFCRPSGGRAAWRPYGGRRRAIDLYPDYGAYGFHPFAPRVTREQELEFLKRQAEALSDEIKELEAEIGKISAEKNKGAV